MAKPRTLQNVFLGMQRDRGRNRLPQGYVWNIINMLPDLEGPLANRGGWSWASRDLDTHATSAITAEYVRGGIYATFSPTSGDLPRNICIDDDGKAYRFTDASSSTALGVARQIAQNPVFHGGTSVSADPAVYTGLVIIPDGNGIAVPAMYDGTTLQNLTGDPPTARYATVYKDYTVLGNGSVGAGTAATAYPNRIWFSPPGDPACQAVTSGWDTTDSWIDFSLPVKGFGSTKNTLLVFHDTHVSRIRGSTPPPDEDMVVDDPWLKVGLLDTFSITEHDEYVYWCAPEGVFRTDGVTHENLAKKGGMLSYWLDLMVGRDSSWTFATGILRNYLIVCVKDGVNGNFEDAFMINLDNFSWVRATNFNFVSMWEGQGAASDELFAAHSNSSDSVARVVSLDSIFQDIGTDLVQDEDGTDVFITLETGFFEVGRPGIKRFRRGYLGFEFGGAILQGSPVLTVQTNVDASGSAGYTFTDGDTGAGGDSSWTTTTVGYYERLTWDVMRRGEGIAFRVTGSGDSARVVIHDVGVETMYQEESKKMFRASQTTGGGGGGGVGV